MNVVFTQILAAVNNIQIIPAQKQGVQQLFYNCSLSVVQLIKTTTQIMTMTSRLFKQTTRKLESSRR